MKGCSFGTVSKHHTLFLGDNAYLVLLQVQDRQEGICIRLIAIHFHGRPQCRLRQDEVRQRRQFEQLSINIKQLLQERLDPMKVNLWLGIKPLKVDVEYVKILAHVNTGAGKDGQSSLRRRHRCHRPPWHLCRRPCRRFPSFCSFWSFSRSESVD